MKKTVENIRLLSKGFSYLFKIEKAYAILHIITSVLSPLHPFINIFIVSKILNELAGSREARILFIYVSVAIISNFFLSIGISSLNLLKGYHSEQFYKNEKMLFAEKAMIMDYEKLEDPIVHALLERIKNESQNGYNMFFLNMFSGQLIGSISSIATSIFLCHGLIVNEKIFIPIKAMILFCIICVIFINYYTTKKTNKKNLEMFESLIPFNTKFNFYSDYYEDYNAGKDIRLYNLGDYVADIQKSQNDFSVNILLKSKKETLKYVFLSSISSDVFNFVIYAFVIFACLTNSITVGDITKYVSCIAMFVSAIGGLISQFQSLFNNNKYLNNYFKYFDIPTPQRDTQLLKIKTVPIIIEFRNVFFKYPNSDTYVLNNLSFIIEAGTRIAVVGMNGSGKTTMIKLLCRLYTPTEGSIFLNGININDYDYEDYIKLLGVVFQDFKIFAFPIGQNIAANDIVNESKVHSVIQKAGLESLLANMPTGIDMPLYKDFDEGGIEISGGEAQKIALARALYKDAPILILDEPTAALDPIAENEIYIKFNEVSENKTVIFISHRLAACTFSDKILVFQEGMITQEGSHLDLLKQKSGKYYELWNAQSQYYQ